MLWLVFALCIVVMLVNSRRPFRITPAAIQLADALGFGLVRRLWGTSVTGKRYADGGISHYGDYHWGIWRVMRDIACGEMPTAFLTIVRMPCVRWLAAGCMRFWRFYSSLAAWVIMFISTSSPQAAYCRAGV